MNTYLKPSQFQHRHGIQPQTLRNYIKLGMPHRMEKGGHISYPEQECLDWIAKRRQSNLQTPPSRVKPPQGTLTIDWICRTCQTVNPTVRGWITKYGAPAYHTCPETPPLDVIYFYPTELLDWMRQYVTQTNKSSHEAGRHRWLTALEAALPQAIETNTNQTETTPTMANTPTQNTAAEPTALKKQFKNYDPCRTYQTGDEIQVVLCNGRSNGIAASLMLLTGTVLKNENAVGIVLCSVNGNPEQIPASNLRLIRAVEDIPRYAILETGHTYYITPKKETESIAFVSYGADSPFSHEAARDLAELILETAKEKNEH